MSSWESNVLIGSASQHSGERRDRSDRSELQPSCWIQTWSMLAPLGDDLQPSAGWRSHHPPVRGDEKRHSRRTFNIKKWDQVYCNPIDFEQNNIIINIYTHLIITKILRVLSTQTYEGFPYCFWNIFVLIVTQCSVSAQYMENNYLCFDDEFREQSGRKVTFLP